MNLHARLTDPALDHSSEMANSPLLGAIRYSFHEEIRSLIDVDDCKQRERHLQRLSLRYDLQYGARPDYRLWRVKGSSRFFKKSQIGIRPTDWSTRWLTKWKDDLELALSGDNIFYKWGAIALAAEILDTELRHTPKGARSDAWKVVRCVEPAVLGGIRPIADCQAGCGMAAVDFLHQGLRVRLDEEWPVESRQLFAFVNKIADYLNLIDSAWAANGQLHADRCVLERNSGYLLRPYPSSYEMTRTISVLAGVGSAIYQRTTNVDGYTRPLFLRAYDFYRTAWHHARARRFHRSELDRERGLWDDEKSRDIRKRLLVAELKYLRRTAQCSRAAGVRNYLEDARLRYLYFRTWPEALFEDKELTKSLLIEDPGYPIVKEAGLIIDPRFFRDSDEVRIEKEGVKGRRANKKLKSHSGPDRGFRLRLAADSIVQPPWHIVARRWPELWAQGRPADVLHHLFRSIADCEEHEGCHDPEVRALFQLACQYGYIRTAGKLFGKLNQPRARDLRDFSHAVKRCMQLDPFGAWIERIQAWLNLITSRWADIELGLNIPLCFSQRHFLHEITMGRLLSSHQRLGASTAALLYKSKALDVVKAEDIRDFYERAIELHRKPAGVISDWRVSTFARSARDSEMGAPVHISIRSVGEKFSYVAIPATGRPEGGIIPDVITTGLFNRDLPMLRNSFRTWFRMPGAPVRAQIPWTPIFRDLARQILNLARACDPNCRALVVAMEPDLSGLPWQHLLMGAAEGLGCSASQFSVSIVPNLGWAPFGRQTEVHEFRVHAAISDEPDSRTQRVASVVSESLAALRGRPTNLSVILGHGQAPSQSLLPIIRIGNATLSTIDEYLPYIQSRVVIVHSCHTGDARHQFLGDFGALPGLALGLGCNVLIAPVAEVSPEAAIALTQALLDERSESSIASRYLRAINECPEVCLYNIYGVATTPMFFGQT